MLSPLYDIQEFFFEEGWDFQREALALTDMAELWADVDAEAQSLDIVLPAGANVEDEDWTIRQEPYSTAPATPAENKEIKEIVHHDCMWGGLCAECADSGNPTNTFVPAEAVTTTPGQSLLRRAPSPPRPETPSSLDEDEPPQFRHAVDVAGTARRLLRDSAAVAADHSYTLAKPVTKHRFENLGVQTPSDSEEEIDVVSLGDKSSQGLSVGRAESLPRIPSAMDQHHIQRTVASAMTPRPQTKKRLSSSVNLTPPRKKARGAGRRARRTPTDTDSDPETPEMERRSLHNDMERMRRIGLKNLFDELKNQIPTTRDKERAPKVVILREAASLCRRLQNEDMEREYLKRQQNKLLAKLKKLRCQLASRYHTY